jgi:hypothetical protein
MSSSATKTSIPALSMDSNPGPNIAFLDWDDAVMAMADGYCKQWAETGAITLIASQLAWETDPRNSVDPNAIPPTFEPRVQYPAPTRANDDTTAVRVLHDRADQKREDFFTASKELKEAMIASLGPALCEAAAAASPNGRLMYLSPRQM